MTFPRGQALLVPFLLVALVAVVAFALRRELTVGSGPASVAPAPAAPSAFSEGGRKRAVTAAEEAFATALYAVHGEVKMAALRLSFAGINYKTEDHDAQKFEAAVRPLVDVFRAALARARVIEAPASLAATKALYMDALGRYVAASEEMLRIAQDGSDEHLLKGQDLTFPAAEDMLRVSDVLWPGEYKPN